MNGRLGYNLLVALLVMSGLLDAHALDSRLSSAVTITQNEPGMAQWLSTPTSSSIDAYVQFKSDLPPDVIFGIDQELFEGTKNPLWVSGGDWMGLVGLQRSGAVWVAAGTPQTAQGTPSTNRNWQVLSLGQSLQPDEWYRLHTEIDFADRKFISFSIEGVGFSKTLDLSGYSLDYPNYAPFDNRAVGNFVFSMRGRSTAQGNGSPVVYFDDVSSAIPGENGTTQQILDDSFEGNRDVKKQPLTGPPIQLDGYQPGQWYFENPNALAEIEKQSFARTGDQVMALDTSLDVVPEPDSLALLASGLCLLGLAMHRKRC